jgi:hypothetical protein
LAVCAGAGSTSGPTQKVKPGNGKRSGPGKCKQVEPMSETCSKNAKDPGGLSWKKLSRRLPNLRG